MPEAGEIRQKLEENLSAENIQAEMQYPVRIGEHSNLAFGLRLALDYAQQAKDEPLRKSITETAQATPANGNGWYDSFSTKLLKEFSSDDNGFYQMEIDPGTYTIVTLDSGGMYSFILDIHSGSISEVRIADGKQKTDLMMVINAVFRQL